jgi:hypothetical protein
MATSNSTNWSLNRDQVITAALRKLAVLPSGGSPSANQVSDASVSLNALIKAFQADGMPLWKITSQTFTVSDGVASYAVGPSQTVNCPKPLKVLQAFATPTDGIQIPMNVYNRYDFQLLPSTSEGTPVNFYYQPLNTTGVVSLWPTPAESTTVITFHYQSPFEDMDSATDDFDFPSEWMNPLIYNLAVLLAPEYGIPLLDRKQLEKEADSWHEYVLGLGSEEGSVYFQPDRQR